MRLAVKHFMNERHDPTTLSTLDYATSCRVGKVTIKTFSNAGRGVGSPYGLTKNRSGSLHESGFSDEGTT